MYSTAKCHFGGSPALDFGMQLKPFCSLGNQPFAHALNCGGIPPHPYAIDILSYTCDAK